MSHFVIWRVQGSGASVWVGLLSIRRVGLNGARQGWRGAGRWVERGLLSFTGSGRFGRAATSSQEMPCPL